MSAYLDDYGVQDARREKVLKRIVIAAVLVALAGVALYFQFRDYREKRQVTAFLSLLAQQDYRAAYALWGCTETNPCPAYSFEKFQEDWGPAGRHAGGASPEIADTRSCRDGIIQGVRFEGEDETWLWVGRADRSIGFAPWPYLCDPHIPVSEFEGGE